MADSVLQILLQLKDDATKQLQDFQKVVEDNKQSLQDFSKVAAVTGAAITAAMGVAVYAAEEDREAWARLSQTVDNSGTKFDDVRGKVNSLTDSQSRNTSFGIKMQLDALNQLVLVTGSVDKAMTLLPTALDLAAAKEIDVSTAAVYLGRIMDGNTAGLTRMMPWLIGVTDAHLALQITMDKVRGAAEATANPFTIMKNSFGELASRIGTLLLPTITELIGKLVNVIDHVMAWIDLHPTLASGLTIAATAFGLLATAIGLVGLAMTTHIISGAIAAIPVIITLISTIWAWVAANIALLASTGVGIIALAAMGVAAAAAVYGIKEAVSSLTAPIESVSESTGKTTIIYGKAPPSPYTSWEEATAAGVPRPTSYQYGGIVPGAIGQPVPIIAHGGEQYLGAGGGGSSVTNIYVAGTVVSENQLMTLVRQLSLSINRRKGITAGSTGVF